MPSKPVYARIETVLHEKVKKYNETRGGSFSATIEDLVQRGLDQLYSEGYTDTLQNEIISLKESIQDLEKEHAALLGSFEACKAKESIAMAAQSHSEELQKENANQLSQIEELRNYLRTPVALCSHCKTQLRLFDIGQQKCSFCGAWKLEWLPEYALPLTTWEVMRDGAAVIGATTIVVALLNALNSGQQKT